MRKTWSNAKLWSETKNEINHPKIWTEKLQRVLNAAARVITGTWKFDSGQILHNDLHWLDVPQRVIFKLCMTVYKCLHGLAPKYIAELCVLVADMLPDTINYVLLAEDLNFPRFYNTSNYGRRAFCFAGPYVLNSLFEHIRQSTFNTCSTSGHHIFACPTHYCPSSVNCFQALTKDISTPADIAPSALETIVF